MAKWYVCYGTNTVAETLDEAINRSKFFNRAFELAKRHEKGWRQWVLIPDAVGTGAMFPDIHIYEVEAESSKDALGMVMAWIDERNADVLAKQREHERTIKVRARQLPHFEKVGNLIIDDEKYLRLGLLHLWGAIQDHFLGDRTPTRGHITLGRARITVELLPEDDAVVESDTSE